MIKRNEDGNNLAEKKKKKMIDKKITVPELAKKMNATRYSIHFFLESLRKGISSLNTICKYANALEISPYELFYESKLVPREPKSKKKGE